MAADDIKNVRTSVFKYIEDNLASAMTGGVQWMDFPGLGLDTKDLDEWMQFECTGPVKDPSRRAARTELWTVTCNAFARSGRDSDGTMRSSMYRHDELAGEFSELFDQYDLAIQDWDTGGDPTIGYLRFGEVAVAQIHDIRETQLNQAAAVVDGWLIL